MERFKFKPEVSRSNITSVRVSGFNVTSCTILGQVYSHFDLNESMLDISFVKTASQIEDIYKEKLSGKPERVRVESWVKRLCTSECCDKIPLLKNRNRYIKLLLTCLADLGRLEGVFKKMPPENKELANLLKPQIIDIEFAAKAQRDRNKRELRL